MILTQSLYSPTSQLEVEKPSGVTKHRALCREQFSGTFQGLSVDYPGTSRTALTGTEGSSTITPLNTQKS